LPVNAKSTPLTPPSTIFKRSLSVFKAHFKTHRRSAGMVAPRAMAGIRCRSSQFFESIYGATLCESQVSNPESMPNPGSALHAPPAGIKVKPNQAGPPPLEHDKLLLWWRRSSERR
jgi:hypothetical protein